MIAQKQHSCQIDLCDRMYESNLEAVYMDALRAQYEGKNYDGAFILSIDRVDSYSSPIICQEMLDSRAQVMVRFTATVLLYVKGYIIPNCRIMRPGISESDAYGRSDHAVIHITMQQWAAGIYRADEVLPVIVNACKYTPGESAISVSATPLMPLIRPLHIFKIVHESDKKISGARLQQLTSLEDYKLTADEKEMFKFFKVLLYPFQHEKEFSTIHKEFRFISLDDIPSKETGYICIPNELDRTRKGAYYAHEIKDKSALVISKLELASIYELAFDEYLLSLINIHGLIKHYKTMENITKHKMLWALYMRHKELMQSSSPRVSQKGE